MMLTTLIVLLACIATQQGSADSTEEPRFCCKDNKNWISFARRCDGVHECPADEEQGEFGGEDEEHCDNPNRRDWCDDLPANTEMEVPSSLGVPLWLIIVIAAGAGLVIVAIIALVVVKMKKNRGDPVSTMEM
jgi:hypothetical protein